MVNVSTSVLPLDIKIKLKVHLSKYSRTLLYFLIPIHVISKKMTTAFFQNSQPQINPPIFNSVI